MRPVPGYSLWLGHARDARDLRALHASGIAAVVDLAQAEPPALLSRDLVYRRFPLVDGPGNPPGLLRVAVETVVHLLRRDFPTLVACGAGMSRSPMIAAAAIARFDRLSLADSLALVAQTGAADVAPGLWAEVKAALESAARS